MTACAGPTQPGDGGWIHAAFVGLLVIGGVFGFSDNGTADDAVPVAANDDCAVSLRPADADTATVTALVAAGWTLDGSTLYPPHCG